MNKKQKFILGTGLALLVFAVCGWFLHAHTISVLQPAGEVGTKERNLIIFCVIISAVIVIPVFGLLIYIATRYHEDNPHSKRKYAPELAGSRRAETIWWVVPSFIMVIISIVTWNSSYALDPFKKLASSKPTLHIQVVAMDWKWLFIYPQQNVASVNEVAIPVGTPVDFEITSDSVMTSFWVPQLGGQMYAMPGMLTHDNLEAAKPGSYNGVAANISGKGFADMKFVVRAVDGAGFTAWQAKAQKSAWSLTQAHYDQLKVPSTMSQPFYYSSYDPLLYNSVIMKYMMPMAHNENSVGVTN
jgi:cytochrome o ubiquinol oxidase subunit 2